jgi:Xaa-Pro aminopeptidase
MNTLANDPYAVDLDACRARQRRLLAAIEPFEADFALLTRRESVQWLTGMHVRAPFEPIAILRPAGRLTLVVPDHQTQETAAADEIVGYEAKWHSTTRDEQLAASSEVVMEKVTSKPKRVACEFEAFSPHLLLAWNATLMEIDAIIFDLRRRKDPDELRMLTRANEANRAMYVRGREIVRPGAIELEIYSELYSVAVRVLGEPPTYFGQDFRSNARGGAPRNRAIQAGETMILDLGVGFRGYHSDNCRTLAVDGNPSEKQQQAWKAAASVFDIIRSQARPGASCRAIFDEAQKQLDKSMPWVFDHHLGHGVGLAPQEGPHLNPCWKDTLAEGDFIAVEPGLYHEELHTGVRLEQNFLVTAAGARLMTDWPLEL